MEFIEDKTIRVNYKNYEEFLTIRVKLDITKTILKSETYCATIKKLVELFIKDNNDYLD